MNFFYQGENIKFTNLSWTKKISRTKNKIVVLLGTQCKEKKLAGSKHKI